MTEHEGAQIESILINKTKVGQASRQVWSGDVNLPDEPSLELAQHGPDVILDQRGVGGQPLSAGWAAVAATGTTDSNFHSPAGCVFLTVYTD